MTEAPVQLTLVLEAVVETPRRKAGRPPVTNKRRHRLRIACNDEELLKFRLLACHHEIKLNVMARDIIMDEVNAMLGECPRPQLVALLHAKGLTDLAIESLLKSI